MHDIVSISWMPHRKKKWCNGAWQKRTPRSGAKWSKAPRPLNQLYWHCRHCFSSSPEGWVEGQGTYCSALRPGAARWWRGWRIRSGKQRQISARAWVTARESCGTRVERSRLLFFIFYFLPIARAGFGELQRTIEAHVDWTPATCRGARRNRNWMI